MTHNELDLQPIKAFWAADIDTILDGVHVVTHSIPLIYRARTDIIALITEVERLRERVEDLGYEINDLVEDRD